MVRPAPADEINETYSEFSGCTMHWLLSILLLLPCPCHWAQAVSTGFGQTSAAPPTCRCSDCNRSDTPDNVPCSPNDCPRDGKVVIAQATSVAVAVTVSHFACLQPDCLLVSTGLRSAAVRVAELPSWAELARAASFPLRI